MTFQFRMTYLALLIPPGKMSPIRVKVQKNVGMAIQHIRLLRKLNGLEVHLLIDPSILMSCDNISAVIIAKTD